MNSFYKINFEFILLKALNYKNFTILNLSNNDKVRIYYFNILFLYLYLADN